MAQFAKKHQPSDFGVSSLVNSPPCSFTSPDPYLSNLLLRHNAEKNQQSIKTHKFYWFQMRMPIQNIREAQHSRWERWQCRRSLQSQPPQAGTLALDTRVNWVNKNTCPQEGVTRALLVLYLSTCPPTLAEKKTGDEERKKRSTHQQPPSPLESLQCPLSAKHLLWRSLKTPRPWSNSGENQTCLTTDCVFELSWTLCSSL